MDNNNKQTRNPPPNPPTPPRKKTPTTYFLKPWPGSDTHGLRSFSTGEHGVTRHGSVSCWFFNLLPLTIPDCERGSKFSCRAVFSASFLLNRLLHYLAISFGDFSLNLQTMFKHNFPLQSSVICPDKIRNCLFLTALASVNISIKVPCVCVTI